MSNETGPTDSPTINPDGFGNWEYVCRFCSRTFPSGRALGGHQNAHRFEPKERKRIRHGRMPRLQANQPGSALAGSPSRAEIHGFAPGNASAFQVGYGQGFQSQGSVAGVGMPMPMPILPGPGENFYQNDSRLFGPKTSPFCENHLDEQPEHSGGGPWNGTSHGAEIQADERAAIDLDLKL